jgi:hypothetical protein
MSKPYPKYKYQSVSIGPKIAEKQAFFSAINRSNLNHSYDLNSSRKRNWCFFYPKKSIKQTKKKLESEDSTFLRTFQLNHTDLIDVLKEKEPKRDYFRGKQIKW